MLFVGLSIFYVIMTIVYWYVDGEPLGITGLMLSAGLAGMVGFYVWFTQKRIGTILPEDNVTAEIADGAGELGFYSPHSWWPLPTGASAVAVGLGSTMTPNDILDGVMRIEVKLAIVRPAEFIVLTFQQKQQEA